MNAHFSLRPTVWNLWWIKQKWDKSVFEDFVYSYYHFFSVPSSSLQPDELSDLHVRGGFDKSHVLIH
jgi:hypothetical protein